MCLVQHSASYRVLEQMAGAQMPLASESRGDEDPDSDSKRDAPFRLPAIGMVKLGKSL